MRLILLLPAIAGVVSSLAIDKAESIFARGDSSTGPTCLKDWDGDGCDSNLNPADCDTAVNDVCNAATTLAPRSGLGVKKTSGTCTAAFTAGSAGWPNANQPTDYASCVSIFQGITSSCIDPSNPGYAQNKQGGVQNVDSSDCSVDENYPSWEIGSTNCIQGGGSAAGRPINFDGSVPFATIMCPTGGNAIQDWNR